jgi:thiol-disulfide isomerase/thioredoxin
MLSSIQGLFGKKNEPNRSNTAEEKANVSVRSPEELGNLDKLVSIGPVTFILVHADWCGPCQNYKPFWKELEKVPGRTANMAMVHHDMVERSPLLKKANIPGYPTVLKVYPSGRIEQYKGNTNAMPDIRDKKNMTKELTNPPGTAYAVSLNTRRNLNNTRVTVHNTLKPSKSLTIGATGAPAISPMKGGNLYAALTRALLQAGPASLLFAASQHLPPKKGTGSTKRLTRKATSRKSTRGGRRGKSRKN